MFFRRSEKEVSEDDLSRTYQRAAIWMAVAAALWLGAWLYGNWRGWHEQSLLIPLGCGALSALLFSLSAKSKQ